MATKSFYLTATTGDGWRTLSETVQAAVTNADGWVTGTGATLHSEYQVGVERATFSGTTVPDGTLDTTLKDAFRTTGLLAGDFASGNWVFTFVVRAVTSAGGQNGRVRFRLIKADADGSNATEITAAQQQGSLVGLMSSTTTDYVSTLTVNPGAITLTDQYLFIQLAWERTVAGSMSTSDVNWRTGSSASLGTRIVTTDFVPADHLVAGATIASTGLVQVPTVIPVVLQEITGTTLAAGSIARGPTLALNVIAPFLISEVIDSYSAGNSNNSLTATTFYQGQTFLGTDLVVNTCRFLFQKTAGTTGSFAAQLYATTGTYGSTARPTGAALATSETLDFSLAPTGRSWQIFPFTGANRIVVTNGVPYAVTLAPISLGGAVSFVVLDATVRLHAGNHVISGNSGGSWSVDASNDMPFAVLSDTVFAPTVTPEVLGDQAVTGTTIAAGATLTAPTVVPEVVGDQAVTTVALGSAATVTAPTVTPGAVTITGVSLASSAGTFAPTLTPSVLPATIMSTITLFAPLVVPTQAITTATIGATSGPSAPTLAAALTAATRVSTSTLFAPTVTTAGAVIGGTIAAGSVLFAPALASLVRARHFGYIMTTS